MVGSIANQKKCKKSPKKREVDCLFSLCKKVIASALKTC
jgi:hypothetical protein